MNNMGKKSLIVKRFGKYGGKVSLIVKNMENIKERQVD
jgi:recombinational DNA repair protein (RecF pathway)